MSIKYGRTKASSDGQLAAPHASWHRGKMTLLRNGEEYGMAITILCSTMLKSG